MRIRIKSSGYYNSHDQKVVLLKEGDELTAEPVDYPRPGDEAETWYKSTLEDGRTAFVEPENCEEIDPSRKSFPILRDDEDETEAELLFVLTDEGMVVDLTSADGKVLDTWALTAQEFYDKHFALENDRY